MDTPKYIPTIDSLEKLDELMSSLLREQGIIGSWEHLEGSSEGKSLPGGVKSESGTILTHDGRVFDFWLGWDQDKTAPDGTKGWYDLGENFKDPQTGDPYPLFKEVLPEDPLYPKPDDPSFVAAKKKLGLA